MWNNLPDSPEYVCVAHGYYADDLENILAIPSSVLNGTLSMMARNNVYSGHIISLVEDRHRSMEFVKWLELVDRYYQEDNRITIILDNHSVHTSKGTMRYLSSRQWRFHFVFTPTHASWLNIIEMFFSKMARSILRAIRYNNPFNHILMILDNFSAHRTENVAITAEILDIELVFLPPYSPQLNPIELIWKSIKKVVSRTFIKDQEMMVDTFKANFIKLSRSK